MRRSEDARDGHDRRQHLGRSMLRLRRYNARRGAAVNTPRQKASGIRPLGPEPEAFRMRHNGNMQDVVIVSAVRTATGKFLGGLKEFTAPQLGAMVIREAVRRAGIDPASVEECLMGNVVSAGVGQAPARQAALGGGLSDHVSATTINKVCGSGLKTVMVATQGIARRGHGHRGRRRHGVDEQLPLPPHAARRRDAHGTRPGRSIR